MGSTVAEALETAVRHLTRGCVIESTDQDNKRSATNQLHACHPITAPHCAKVRRHGACSLEVLAILTRWLKCNQSVLQLFIPVFGNCGEQYCVILRMEDISLEIGRYADAINVSAALKPTSELF